MFENQKSTDGQGNYGGQRQLPRVAGRDAQHDEGKCVVIHDDRGRPAEAPECFRSLVRLGEHSAPVPTPQCRSHKQHVRHPTEKGVREYRALHGAHFRPNRRTVATPRPPRRRLRYQKSTRRRIRTGPGRSIVRLQEP